MIFSGGKDKSLLVLLNFTWGKNNHPRDRTQSKPRQAEKVADHTANVEGQDDQWGLVLTNETAQERIGKAIFAFPGHYQVIVCMPSFDSKPGNLTGKTPGNS